MNRTNKLTKIMCDGKTWVLGATLAATLLAGGCPTGPKESEEERRERERAMVEARLKNKIERSIADCFNGQCGRDHTNTGQMIGTEAHRLTMFTNKNSHAMHQARTYLNSLNTEYDKIQAHVIADSPRQCHLRGIKVNEVRIGTLGDESRFISTAFDPNWVELTTINGVTGNGDLRPWLDEILRNN